MCGICGKITLQGDPAREELLSAMCGRMARRGPDDERVLALPQAGLGQRRLAIIDLNRSAAPPLTNEDETIHVVFNGEIYNYRELRADLTARGHRLRTASDTETIVHLYEEHGEACVERMRGMFAFALWDARRQRLFAARDRVGKKPFFYAKTARSLVFASTIQALLADPEVSRDPDFQALDEFFTWRCVPSPATAFRGIRKLPPAHTLTCDAQGTVTTTRYWTPGAGRGAAPADAAEAEERLTSILGEAVRLRMIADVPLGAFLSGGIDSGLMVSFMAEQSSRPVETFSIGFDDPDHDERRYARLVAERYGTDHHETVVRPDVAEVLPMLVREYGEPFADSSAIPSYYVAKLARERVTVALSGDGGDESFGGYEHYGQQLRWALVDRTPLGIRGPIGNGVARALDALPHHRWIARASRGFHNLGGTLAERYRLQMSCWKPQEKRALYSRWFRAEVAGGEATAAEADELTPLAWMSRHDLTHYLPDCLMVKVDVASMANSLEVRCPLLDQHVIEFAAGLPDGWKRQAGTGKVILRSLARKRLPAEVVGKRKTGFSIPQGAWLQKELREFTRSILLDDEARNRGLFRHDFVERLLREHGAGKRDWSNRLWSLLCFELWFREFQGAGTSAGVVA
jgi:asparagine synthase (glutamine-hydrolysing)